MRRGQSLPSYEEEIKALKSQIASLQEEVILANKRNDTLSSEYKEIENKLNIINDVSSDFVYSSISIGGPFNIEWVSGAFEHITGYTKEEVNALPDKWRSLIYKEDKKLVFNSSAFNKERGLTGTYTYRILSKNNEIRWLEDTMKPVYNEQGELIKTLGSVRDITKTKNAELAIRRSEQNFRSFFNTINEFLFVVDLDGKIIDVNDYCSKNLGYEPHELHRTSVIDLHPANIREDAYKSFEEILSGKSKMCDLPIQRKDGSILRAETQISRGVWNGRDVFFSITKDISDLQISEEKFSQAFNFSTTPMAIVRIEDGIFLETNKSFTRLLGYKSEEINGHKLTEINGITSQESILSMQKRLKTYGKVENHEISIFAKPGINKKVLVSIEKINFNNWDCLLINLRDVTFERKAEEQLFLLITAIEQSKNSIFVTDQNGLLEYANNSYFESTGVKLEDALNTTPNIFLEHYHSNSHNYQNIIQTISNGQTWKGEFLNKTVTNEIFWEKATITPVKDLDGKIEHYITINEDITDQKLQKMELEQAADIWKNMQNGVLIFSLQDKNDPDSLHLTSHNPSAERIIGHKLIDYVGKRLEELEFSKDLRTYAEKLAKVVISGQIIQKEEFTIKIQDKKQWYGFNAFPLPGHKVGITFEDITIRKKVEQSLIRRMQYLQTISNLSKEFINVPTHQIDALVVEALRFIGKLTNEGHAYIFRYKSLPEQFELAYEWNDESTLSLNGIADTIPCHPSHPIYTELVNNKFINASSDHLDSANEGIIHQLLTGPGINSYIHIPLFINNNLYGFLGIDSKSADGSWDEELIELYKLVGQTISNAIHRQQAEQRLKANEQELKAIFEGTPTTLMLIDSDRKIRKINQAGLKSTPEYLGDKIIGLKGGEAMGCLHALSSNKGCGFGEHCEHCTVRETVMDTIERGINHSKVEANIPLMMPNGEYEMRFLSVSTTALMYSHQNMTLVAMEDITDRKKAQQQLQANEQRYRAIIESANDAVFVADTETGMIIDANKKALEIIGKSRDEIADLHQTDLHPKEKLDFAKDTFRQDATTNTDNVIRNVDLINSSGEWIPTELSPAKFKTADGKVYLVGFFRDIRERIKAKEALQESEQKYKSLFKEMTGGFSYHKLNYDTEGKAVDYTFLEVNNAFEKIAGKKAEEVIDKRVSQVLPNMGGKRTELFAQVVATGNPIRFEDYSIIHDKYYEVSAYSPVKDHFAVLSVDITDRVKASKALEIKGEHDKLISEISGELINTAPKNMVKIIKRSIEKLATYLNCQVGYIFSADGNDNTYSLDYFWCSMGIEVDSGTVRYLSINQVDTWLKEFITTAPCIPSTIGSKDTSLLNIPIIHQENVIGFIGFVSTFKREWQRQEEHLVNICGQILNNAIKRNETFCALQESESRLKSMSELADEGILIHEDFVIIETNLALSKITGYSRDELIDKEGHFLVSKSSQQKLRENLKLGFKNPVILEGQHKNGSNYYMQARGQKYIFQGKNVNVVIIRDVTRLYEAQKKLAESETKFRTLAENIPGVIYMHKYNRLKTPVFFNDEVLALTGYSKSSFLTEKIKLSDLIDPQDSKSINKKIKTAVEKKKPFHLIYKLTDKKGNKKWVEEFGSCVYINNKPAFIEGFIIDITERILNEQARLEAEENLMEAQKIAHIGNWTFQKSDNSINLSDEMYNIYELERGKPVPVEYFRKCIHPNDADLAMKIVGWAAASSKKIEIDHRIIVNGKTKWVRQVAQIIDNEIGELEKIIGLTYDITMEKQAQLELENSQKFLQSIINNLPVGLEVFDANGYFMQWNPSFRNIFNIRNNILYNRENLNCLTDKYYKNTGLTYLLQKAYNGKNINNIENLFDFKNYNTSSEKAGRKWLSLSTFPVIGADDNIQAVVLLVQDIDSRKNAENQLIGSEEKFSKAFDLSPDMMLIVDEDSRSIVEVNRSFEETLGFTKLESQGSNGVVLNFWTNLNDRELFYSKLEENDGQLALEGAIKNKSGDVLTVEMAARRIVFNDNKHVIVILRDVTEKRKNEDKIRKSQQELIELNKQMAEYRLMALRSAMNPHFIFNCLNSIQFYIAKNEKRPAISYLSLFSKLIRSVLNSSVSRYISLEKELEILKYYIELEKMRFDNKFDVQFILDKSIDYENTEVPSLMLQPFVENAIIHGLCNKEEEGHLIIRLDLIDKKLNFIIEDDGIGREEARRIRSRHNADHKSIGMSATTERINIINKTDNLSVKVTDLMDESNNAAGTRVEINLDMN